MNKQEKIYTLLLIVTLITALAGLYSLYLSIKGESSWALPTSLGLITIGNGLSYYANTRLKGKKEKKNS